MDINGASGAGEGFFLLNRARLRNGSPVAWRSIGDGLGNEDSQNDRLETAQCPLMTQSGHRARHAVL
jgi:hypothetical protein